MTERKMGITTSKDLPEHPEYIEIMPTKAPDVALKRKKQKQRRVKP